MLGLQVATRTVGPACSNVCLFTAPYAADLQLCAYSIPGGSIIVQQVRVPTCKPAGFAQNLCFPVVSLCVPFALLDLVLQ